MVEVDLNLQAVWRMHCLSRDETHLIVVHLVERLESELGSAHLEIRSKAQTHADPEFAEIYWSNSMQLQRQHLK